MLVPRTTSSGPCALAARPRWTETRTRNSVSPRGHQQGHFPTDRTDAIGVSTRTFLGVASAPGSSGWQGSAWCGSLSCGRGPDSRQGRAPLYCEKLPSCKTLSSHDGRSQPGPGPCAAPWGGAGMCHSSGAVPHPPAPAPSGRGSRPGEAQHSPTRMSGCLRDRVLLLPKKSPASGVFRAQDETHASDCHGQPCKQAIPQNAVRAPWLSLGHVIPVRLPPPEPTFHSGIFFLRGPFKAVVLCTDVKPCPVPPDHLATVYCNKISSYICRNCFGVILFYFPPPNLYNWTHVDGKKEKTVNRKEKLNGSRTLGPLQ